MPITLTQIASNTARVSFVYAGSIVNIVYCPSLLTESALAQLKQVDTISQETALTGFASLNEFLVQIIRSWDVYEDDAQTQMFPLDPVRLSELPIAFRLQAMQTIIQDIRPEALTPQPIQS